MITSYKKIVATGAVLAGFAHLGSAQPTGFQGPVSGAVYLSHSVRPLQGTPRAAHLGAPLLGAVQWASVAPGGDWAVIAEHGRSRLIRGLASGAPSEAAPQGLMQGINRAAWSRDGSAALFYSSSQNQLQRVRIAGAGARADAPIAVPDAAPVAVLAIASGGDQAAFAVAGGAGALYLLPSGGSPVLLSRMANPAAAVFDDSGNRLYVIDGAAAKIWEFASSAGPFEFASLPQVDGVAPEFAGLALSGGGRYLLVADVAGRAIRVYETASQMPAATIPLDFAPSRLEALSNDPLFLLNGDRRNEWLLILDARQTPGVFFVPAIGEEPR
jgi:hypothetical protein